MSQTRRTLDIDEDLRFQEKEWLFQRIGVGVLFLFVLAALLGLTGMGGAMSRAEAGDQGAPVFVEYERFVRRGSRSTMKLHLRGAPGEMRFWISAPYFDRVRVQSVAPPPEQVSVDSERHVYVIRTGSGEVTVTVELEHDTVGRADAELGLAGGPSVRISQLAIF
jgi:hypothetical protein